MPKVPYTQKFRAEWLTNELCRDWISSESDTTKAYCKFCRCTIRARFADIKSHNETKKHKMNSDPFSNSRQRKVSFPIVNRTGLEINKAEGRQALFIVEHCAILATDHLTELCKDSFYDSEIAKKMTLKRTKCCSIIKNILGPHFQLILREDIADQKFSLLLDESTDISVKKYLGMAVRYYSKTTRRFVSTFLKLVPLIECNADGLVEAVKNTLKEFQLQLSNLIGIATDNANVMVGVNNGVYQKLKQEVPSLILIRCVCHSLQLATSQAAEDALPRNIDFLISETYNWFSHSSNRQSTYAELYGLMNDGHEPLKIVRACNTRWLSIYTAVERIYNQWLELKTYFEIARLKEKCYSAEILYQMYCDDANQIYLLFLKSILKDVNRINKSFESNDADITKLLEDLNQLLQSMFQTLVLPSYYGKVDPMTCKIEDYLSPKIYFGHEVEIKLSAINKGQEIIRERCLKFLIALFEQIRQRLPDNIHHLRHASLFAIENALKIVNKESILPFLQSLQIKDDRITEIERQWQNLTLVKWNARTTFELWIEVKSYKDSSDSSPFKELAEVAINILSLPHSNAEIERVFSQLNIVKNKQRNRMKVNLINSILAIRAGLRRLKTNCFNYELPNDVLNLIGTKASYDDTLTEEFEMYINW